MILFKGIRDSTNSLYHIDDSIFVNCKEINVFSNTCNLTSLWHAKLGHPFIRLQTLIFRNFAYNLPNCLPKNSKPCETCMFGKHCCLPFPDATLHRAHQPSCLGVSTHRILFQHLLFPVNHWQLQHDELNILPQPKKWHLHQILRISAYDRKGNKIAHYSHSYS